MVFVIRNLRFIGYLDAVRDAAFMLDTLKFLTKPILSKFFFVYLVFYEFAYLGAILFGGKITYAVYEEKLSGSPPFYYLMNFNDFGASIIVLFQQMVVNNWFVVVDMYTTVIGTTWWVRLFFISFWVIVVLILMNIMIAIVLEIYGTVTVEVDVKFEKL